MPLPRSGITLRIPHPVYRIPSAANPFQDYLGTYDFAIGGIPFRADTSPENPLIRSSAQFRKDQFDNGTEPGEQSLSGWWIRSQSSWHMGAGIVNSDPRLDETAEVRYADSEGINPWVRGQLTLLHAMDAVGAAPAAAATHALGVDAGGDAVLYSADDALYLVDADGVADEIDWGGSSIILSLATDGESWYAASDDGIYSGPLTGTTDGAKLWTVSADAVVIKWVKGRLLGGVDNALYELVPPVGAAPHALPTAVYQHPADRFVWTGIAEGPEAVYALGYSGTESMLLRMSLQNSGALPALSLATSAAELPRNELGTALYSYLGKYLLIGTNKGARVATLAAEGEVDYGPLISTPAPVRDFVAMDHFVWAGYTTGFSDGTSGALRIDLAEVTTSGRNAYAKDARVHIVGDVSAVTTLGTQDRLVLAIDSGGLFFESDDYEPSGWFLTGRVRHNTFWPKLFRRFNLKADLLGPIDVASLSDTGNEVELVTVSTPAQMREDLAINFPVEPQEFLQLRFTLHRNPDDSEESPIFRGYQLKSLPGGPRPRQFVIPLRCYDSEKDQAGVRSGYEGFGLERLTAIEALDSAAEVVLFEDLTNNTAIPVTIEQLEFRQITTPQPSGETWGGVLTVVLRTLQ